MDKCDLYYYGLPNEGTCRVLEQLDCDVCLSRTDSHQCRTGIRTELNIHVARSLHESAEDYGYKITVSISYALTDILVTGN